MSERKSLQILWVDDDVDDIRYLLYPLEKEGYKIEKIAYLPEAYDVLAKTKRFDLVVLDLLMPPTDRFGDKPDWLENEHPKGANGVSLLIRMREHLGTQIPVLILSVVPDAIEEMDISSKYNPVDFVHKSSNQIQAAIDKIREILIPNESE